MMKFLHEYGGEIIELSADHLFLTGLAMLIACGIAVPLGIVLTRLRSQRLARAILGIVNIVQPIPSLALVALAAVFFLTIGLPTIGIVPGLVALVAYALLPVLRNTYTGIRQVDPTVVEVAVGMGMTRRQVLFSVELPLALPVVMAGIRIATVWTIGVATLVSLIGADSLGKPIFRGLSRGRVDLILAGALPAAALALIFDWLLGQFEKWLTPSGFEDGRSRAL